MGRNLLITGAILNFIIAAGHIAALFFLDWAFEFTGIADNIEKYAWISPWMHYGATLLVAILFVLMGIYGLSGARVVRKMPLLKPGIILITIIYIGRGVLGLAYEILSQEQWMNGIVFACLALLIGLCYLSGGLWRWHGKGQGKYYGE